MALILEVFVPLSFYLGSGAENYMSAVGSGGTVAGAGPILQGSPLSSRRYIDSTDPAAIKDRRKSNTYWSQTLSLSFMPVFLTLRK